jgi:hypothetical protein
VAPTTAGCLGRVEYPPPFLVVPLTDSRSHHAATIRVPAAPTYRGPQLGKLRSFEGGWGVDLATRATCGVFRSVRVHRDSPLFPARSGALVVRHHHLERPARPIPREPSPGQHEQSWIFKALGAVASALVAFIGIPAAVLVGRAQTRAAVRAASPHWSAAAQRGLSLPAPTWVVTVTTDGRNAVGYGPAVPSRLLRPDATGASVRPRAATPPTCCDGPQMCALVRRCTSALPRSRTLTRMRPGAWKAHCLFARIGPLT